MAPIPLINPPAVEEIEGQRREVRQKEKGFGPSSCRRGEGKVASTAGGESSAISPFTVRGVKERDGVEVVRLFSCSCSRRRARRAEEEQLGFLLVAFGWDERERIERGGLQPSSCSWIEEGAGAVVLLLLGLEWECRMEEGVKCEPLCLIDWRKNLQRGGSLLRFLLY